MESSSGSKPSMRLIVPPQFTNTKCFTFKQITCKENPLGKEAITMQ